MIKSDSDNDNRTVWNTVEYLNVGGTKILYIDDDNEFDIMIRVDIH